jgi:hypothetical protein
MLFSFFVGARLLALAGLVLMLGEGVGRPKDIVKAARADEQMEVCRSGDVLCSVSHKKLPCPMLICRVLVAVRNLLQHRQREIFALLFVEDRALLFV